MGNKTISNDSDRGKKHDKNNNNNDKTPERNVSHISKNPNSLSVASGTVDLKQEFLHASGGKDFSEIFNSTTLGTVGSKGFQRFVDTKVKEKARAELISVTKKQREKFKITDDMKTEQKEANATKLQYVVTRKVSAKGTLNTTINALAVVVWDELLTFLL